MLLINRDDAIQCRYGFFGDTMFWFEKVRIFDDLLVQYVHICALNRQCIELGRILYTNKNDMICHHLLCNTSASVTTWDRVLYNSIVWFHIWICTSMFNIVNNPSSLFSTSLPYTMKSY